MKTLDLLYIYDWLFRNFTNFNIVKIILDELDKYSVDMGDVKKYITDYLLSPKKYPLEVIQYELTVSLRNYILDNPHDNSIPDIFKITKDVNDNFRYSKDFGKTWIDIIIPEGIYDFNHLSKYMDIYEDFTDLQDKLKQNLIYIHRDSDINKVRLVTRNEFVHVDLTVPSSVGKTLGFEPQILTKDDNISENKISEYLDQRYFYIHPLFDSRKFKILKHSILPDKKSKSTIYNLLGWLSMNLDNYIYVATIVSKCDWGFWPILSHFKHLYTFYLLTSETVHKEMLINELVRIQKGYRVTDDDDDEFKDSYIIKMKYDDDSSDESSDESNDEQANIGIKIPTE